MREYEKQLRTKQAHQAKLEDKIKELNDQILRMKKANAIDGESINVEDIKLSKIKADEKLEEYQRVTAVLVKSKE